MYRNVTVVRRDSGEIISRTSRTFDERRFDKWVNDTHNRVNSETQFDDEVRKLTEEGFVITRNDRNQITMARGSESAVVSLYEYD